jgi:hypothetical protein
MDPTSRAAYFRRLLKDPSAELQLLPPLPLPRLWKDRNKTQLSSAIRLRISFVARSKFLYPGVKFCTLV